jgi:hypothetical protein
MTIDASFQLKANCCDEVVVCFSADPESRMHMPALRNERITDEHKASLMRKGHL